MRCRSLPRIVRGRDRAVRVEGGWSDMAMRSCPDGNGATVGLPARSPPPGGRLNEQGVVVTFEVGAPAVAVAQAVAVASITAASTAAAATRDTICVYGWADSSVACCCGASSAGGVAPTTADDAISAATAASDGLLRPSFMADTGSSVVAAASEPLRWVDGAPGVTTGEVKGHSRSIASEVTAGAAAPMAFPFFLAPTGSVVAAARRSD